ncbi:hypothetical protein ALO69_102486 [Pseudomonas ficuserectae]|uniref:Uncharacterized protein n=1 Tax=Pseudomonas amygdali pv. mori TaxID=34065 RepID=A0A0N8S8N8_PSEA0|nr:hypothetical protein ALO69_102486 [Pseudomonas ficuserectae]KPY02112.1 hypothetical protein ALO63_102400 [Pseudomonas amygdali pv. mori]RMS37292.1 hypothetical protein ALP67_102062 [Pseudomonas ficuserectae]
MTLIISFVVFKSCPSMSEGRFGLCAGMTVFSAFRPGT